ncbi:hypothetical protein LSH36_38g01039 [Paralvinella palmiformis]|uniref:Uncharacterized protein n=1 Tax=Paralvinella palmiformis TaxID=53620 RepID=A0AAD9K7Y4_9ANNE|nr:hypothetical protein LSH36_38g01039 [Paralvinella palmiformis]
MQDFINGCSQKPKRKMLMKLLQNMMVCSLFLSLCVCV